MKEKHNDNDHWEGIVMRDEMKRTMFELFGVGGEDDKVLAAGGKKQPGKSEPMKPAPVAAKPAVQPVAAKPQPAASYLASGTALEGTLHSDGDIEIAGSFKGEIITSGTVTLRSVIQSNITAGSLKLMGCTLTGDVKVTGTVTVSEDSQVTGNISAKELLCAGKINGDLEVSGSTTLEEKAQISGGLVTGMLAVVKGAVIRGGVEIKAFSAPAKPEQKGEKKAD